VLPTLVGRLQAIAVEVENVRCVIAGIVLQARAGLAVIKRASLHRRVVERIHQAIKIENVADKNKFRRDGLEFFRRSWREGKVTYKKSFDKLPKREEIVTIKI
jgi:hypothetical protein